MVQFIEQIIDNSQKSRRKQTKNKHNYCQAYCLIFCWPGNSGEFLKTVFYVVNECFHKVLLKSGKREANHIISPGKNARKYFMPLRFNLNHGKIY